MIDCQRADCIPRSVSENHERWGGGIPLKSPMCMPCDNVFLELHGPRRSGRKRLEMRLQLLMRDRNSSMSLG